MFSFAFSIQNIMEEHHEVIRDIVTIAINDMTSIIIPALQQVKRERSPVKQSSSKDIPTAHNDHLSHIEDTKPDNGISQHSSISLVTGHLSYLSPTCLYLKLEEPDSNETESLLCGKLCILNADLLNKAESFIWKAIREVMEEIETTGSSSVDRVESEPQCSSDEYCHHLKSTTSSTHEGFYDGDKTLQSEQSVSLTNPNIQWDAVACREQMFMDPSAKKTQHGQDSWNQVKIQFPEPKLCSSEHSSSFDTTQRNLIYSQFVDDVLAKVYSFVAEESVEGVSQTETICSSFSSSCSSRMHTECLPLQADKSNSTPVSCASTRWEHHVEKARRNTSVSPKLPLGRSIRLLAAEPLTPEEEVTVAETGLYADEMVMDIMNQIKHETEEQSGESKHSETPDSFTWSEESVVMNQGVDVPLVVKWNPLRTPKFHIYHEAVEICHQIFLSIKRQLDQACSNSETDVSKAMEKAIICEFVDFVQDRLSNMCGPNKCSITKNAEMKRNLSEHSLGCESSEPEKSLKASGIMEKVKMQFEKAAQQPVKAVLESALSDFFCWDVDLSKCASTENLRSCQNRPRAMSKNQTDLSHLASDIILIVWEKLIETSGCEKSCDSEAKLKNLIKAISEISSLNTCAAHANTTALGAELVLEGINRAVETKLMQFITQQSVDDQRATDKTPLVKKTAQVYRSLDGMNCFSNPVNSHGQDVHGCVPSTPSESAFKHSHEHNLFPKQTYTASQLSCSSSPFVSSSELDNFLGTLSKSAMSLLKDTYGEQVTNLKIKKDVNTCLADPTFEGLVIQPDANGRDVIVHCVAVEELFPLCQARSLENERNNERSTHTQPTTKPPEVICPGFPEQINIVDKASVRIQGSQISQPKNLAISSPAATTTHLFKPTIETFVAKVIDKCMQGSKLITKQGELSYERHRMKGAIHASGSPHKVLSDMTRSLKDCRPHSAAAHSRGKSIIYS